MTFLAEQNNFFQIEVPNQRLAQSAKELVQELLPQIFAKIAVSENEAKNEIIELQKKLPLIQYSFDEDSTLSLKIISFKDTNGEIAPFIYEMISKNLLLSRELIIKTAFSLSFSFCFAPFPPFFLAEYTVQVKNEKEKKAILEALPYFLDQLKINLLSLNSARHLSALQNAQIETRPEMNHFIYKFTSQKNLLQVKENLTRLMNRKFTNFDSRLFETIRNLSTLFKESFIQERQPRYISRLIAFIYLFKKLYLPASPERQVRCKLFKNIYPETDKKKKILGLLIAVKINHETERFEQKHLIQALKSCIPYLTTVKDSFLQENSLDNFKIFYVEAIKNDGSDFSLDEIKSLKNELVEEIKERIEKLLSPIFMPRNEEEILRNIILLSKQLKYVRDIPQMIITYDKQTEKELTFQVILLRILKKADSHPIEKMFLKTTTFLKFIPEETKIIGMLKKKYPKEANLFKVSLAKDPYFRKDFSLDLQKARCGVASELTKILGECRDFNGGMIFKQSQALYQLKKELNEINKDEDFLLENFFFSLKPAIQQSILEVETLKAFFLLFLQVIEADLSEQKFLIKTLSMPKYILIMIGSEDGSFKELLEQAFSKLKLSSFDLTSCFYKKNHNHAVGYIYKTTDLAKHSLFYHVLLNALSDWKKNIPKKPE